MRYPAWGSPLRKLPGSPPRSADVKSCGQSMVLIRGCPFPAGSQVQGTACADVLPMRRQVFPRSPHPAESGEERPGCHRFRTIFWSNFLHFREDAEAAFNSWGVTLPGRRATRQQATLNEPAAGGTISCAHGDKGTARIRHGYDTMLGAKLRKSRWKKA